MYRFRVVAIAAVLAMSGKVMLSAGKGDAAKGKVVFEQCAVCHNAAIRGHVYVAGHVLVSGTYCSVRDAVVLASETEAGNSRLIAYLTPAADAAPLDRLELRQFLSDRLPDYMVPTAFIVLDEMPLTANKKIDRNALRAIDATPSDHRDFVASRDDLEWALAQSFAEVLRIERVGADCNFFELGGDSLLASRIVSRIRDTFRADITIPQLFRATNVAALARHVRGALPSGQADKIATTVRRLHNMSPAEKIELLKRRRASTIS